MSSGQFLTTRYELDDGNIVRIRVQPETVTAWNPLPAATTFAEGYPSAQVNKGKREFGIGARFVTLRWVAAPPTGYLATGTVKVPILSTEAYDGLVPGEQVEYLGVQAQVISKSPESVK